MLLFKTLTTKDALVVYIRFIKIRRDGYGTVSRYFLTKSNFRFVITRARRVFLRNAADDQTFIESFRCLDNLLLLRRLVYRGSVAASDEIRESVVAVFVCRVNEKKKKKHFAGHVSARFLLTSTSSQSQSANNTPRPNRVNIYLFFSRFVTSRRLPQYTIIVWSVVFTGLRDRPGKIHVGNDRRQTRERRLWWINPPLPLSKIIGSVIINVEQNASKKFL